MNYGANDSKIAFSYLISNSKSKKKKKIIVKIGGIKIICWHESRGKMITDKGVARDQFTD